MNPIPKFVRSWAFQDRAFYNSTLNIVFVSPGSEAIVILHEIGHSQDARIQGFAMSNAQPASHDYAARLPLEAFAWRYAVKVIRRHRPLREDEKELIRQNYGGYVKAAMEQRCLKRVSGVFPASGI